MFKEDAKREKKNLTSPEALLVVPIIIINNNYY